jgi:chromosome segregation ATPase
MFALMTSLEIVVLAAGVCLIGYFMGRATYQPPRDGSPQEAPFLRQRIDSLEAGYAVVMDERDELRRELASYAALEEQLRELKTAKAAAWEAQAELERLQAVLAEMTVDLDELQAANGLADQLERHLAAQDEHISRLEVALQEQRDFSIGLDLSELSPGDHDYTGGSGLVTDAVIAAVE